VEAGVERLKQAGIDVVIMDLQYAPAVLKHPLHRDMLRALAKLGKDYGVSLFRRFAVMQHWAQAEQLDFADMLARMGSTQRCELWLHRPPARRCGRRHGLAEHDDVASLALRGAAPQSASAE